MLSVFLIKAYCLSLYDCTLWSLSCKSLHVIQVAINNAFRKVWNLPFKSHTAIVHCVARIFPICNLIFHQFNKLYFHAISHSSAIVKSTFLHSSSLIYAFFGHNYMSGHKYLTFYNSYDIYCANIIRNYRYYYGLFSPYEDVYHVISPFSFTLLPFCICTYIGMCNINNNNNRPTIFNNNMHARVNNGTSTKLLIYNCHKNKSHVFFFYF